MINIIYSNDENLNKFSLENNISKFKNQDILIFDYADNALDIINGIKQTSFFNDFKCILIKNASFLTHELNDFENELIELLLSSNDKEIILVVKSLKLSENKTIQNFIKKANLIKPKKMTDFDKEKKIIFLIKENNINIQNNAQKLLISLLPLDEKIIINEIKKIKELNLELIDKNIIEKFIVDYNSNNVFDIITSFLKKDIVLCNKTLEKLLLQKYQPIELIQIMATQLFNIKLMKWCLSTNNISNSILLELGISFFQFNVNRDLLYNVSYEKINKLLLKMYDLDIAIKKGLVDPYIGIKLLLIGE